MNHEKSLIYLIALCLSYTAMQAVCKYAEEQREDRGGGVPIAALIRLGMGYGISVRGILKRTCNYP
ncbi:hypothetical protein ACLJB4_00125 [Campylobacter coli]|uniref:hypothetical protein n=1 Tax=Campylobacter coli TaxID=195 RepID=UPI003F7CADD4